jgi:hypothetical protein
MLRQRILILLALLLHLCFLFIFVIECNLTKDRVLQAVDNQKDLNVSEKLMSFIEENLAPWLPFPGSDDKILRSEMFDALERIAYGMGARVRIYQGRIFFRQLMLWEQSYYYARLRFHLSMIHEAVRTAQIPDTELFIAVPDGPRTADDTSAPIHGLPMFNYISSPAHLDVLVPDPFEIGAYGNRYNFKTQPPLIPWENKSSRLNFRGGFTSFRHSAHNWNMSPRARAAILSQQNPSVYDMHLTSWGSGATDDFKADSGLKLAPKVPLEHQCGYKWVLNLDGGWGSCRMPSILRCGSLLIQQRSPWITISNKMLKEGVHYIAVDRHLRTLGAVVDWLQDNDGRARTMAAAAQRLGSALFTRQAALEYWVLLLRRWAGLFRPGQDFAPRDSDWDHCSEPGRYQKKLRASPHNCTRGWLEFTSLSAFDDLYPGIALER